MTPTADQIAAAIIVAARIAKVDPLLVAQGKTRIKKDQIGVARARRMVVLALTYANGRQLNFWAKHLGWAANDSASSVYWSNAKEKRLHESSGFVDVVQALGRTLDETLKLIEPNHRLRVQQEESAAIGRYLSSIPKSRSHILDDLRSAAG